MSSAWREDVLTRAKELKGLESWIDAHGAHDTPTSKLHSAVKEHLDAAGRTAAGEDGRSIKRMWRVLNGSSLERTLGNLDAAEVDLLRLAPSSVLIPALPSIQAHVNRYLPKDDPRRQAVERIARFHTERLLREYEAHSGSEPRDALRHQLREKLGHEQRQKLGHEQGETLGQELRDVFLSAQHAANSQRRRDLIRLRTFRNLLAAGILVFVLLGIGLGLVGSISPTTMPLCFTPEAEGRVTVVCPRAETPLGVVSPGRDLDPDPGIARTVTGGDVWLVALLGLIGAALTGAAALRTLGSNSAPYSVPVTLIGLKLPTGAVSAVVGLLLMRAEFIPGLSALDSSAQILGWAVIFGIAQHLVTQVADNQAAGLLENIKGRGAAGDRQLKGQ